MDEYRSKKAKLKTIIRHSLANDNGNTSQKPIIEIHIHDGIIDVELSASAMRNNGSNDVVVIFFLTRSKENPINSNNKMMLWRLRQSVVIFFAFHSIWGQLIS